MQFLKAEEQPHDNSMGKQDLALLAAQFMSGGSLTEQQTDKVLDEQTRVNQYKREDNKESHIRAEGMRKTRERMFIYALIFAVFLIALVAWRTPEYLTQALSAVAGFLGGMGVGKYIFPEN